MRLILSRGIAKNDIHLIYSVPNLEITDEIQHNMKKMHVEYTTNSSEDKEKFKENGPFLSYFFDIPSAWFPEIKEMLMLTLYIEDHENTHFFTKIMENTVNQLYQIPDLSKAFYLTVPHIEENSFKIFGQMIQILTDCFFEAAKIHETYNLGIAEVLFLGNKGGGKSSIVDYLLHGKFIPQKTPTLTPRVLQMLYEQLDFRVLDVCCTEHVKEILEDHPIEPGKLPQAVVYVIDSSNQGNEEKAAIQEFHNWISFLKNKYPSKQFSNLPFLIFFNKIDLMPNFDLEKYKNQYNTIRYGIKAQYHTTSAITGEGIAPNFRWLVEKLKISSKY
ncbi:ADP-ribosylation factor-like protein [Promethearchaeum syntrophicum]|uniref:ADP-ribosylation factor-like protein n=1 Tax=Promethearchaeum syntrophicum TaxID=2594042 RepID=A0A5B9D7P4_9ARCH|nr:ADP-ribosylation factor-like protein [Candidatus Prometheoarchaeum syntrophicum]